MGGGRKRHTEGQSAPIISRKRENFYQRRFPETELSSVGLSLRYAFIYREGDNGREDFSTQVFKN